MLKSSTLGSAGGLCTFTCTSLHLCFESHHGSIAKVAAIPLQIVIYSYSLSTLTNDIQFNPHHPALYLSDIFDYLMRSPMRHLDISIIAGLWMPQTSFAHVLSQNLEYFT